MARDKMLARLLSLPSIFVLLFLGLIPITFPIFSEHEGEMFPVVENVTVWITDIEEDGVIIYTSFDKVRSCEYIGISWYDEAGKRLVFDLTDSHGPRSRPIREDQFAGPWKIYGIQALEGTEAIVSHRCNPYWITYTRFFP